MKKYNHIEEVRQSIDGIDVKILELISDRKKLVEEAVKLKSREQIVDQERIDRILKKLSSEAKKKSLPNGLVEKIWEAMIKGFIEYEEKIFDDVHKEN